MEHPTRIAAVLALLLLPLGCNAPEQQPAPSVPVETITGPGWWNPRRSTETNDALTAGQREEAERLASLGYVSGSIEPATDDVITVHDRERAWAGLNLFNSGHAPEAFLADMEGNVIHRWSYRFVDVWPDAPTDKVPRSMRDWWRRVHLLDNGELLAIFEGAGVIKLDRNSNLLWEQQIGAHHDLHVLPDGRIVVLARTAGVLPSVHPTEPTFEDIVMVLDENGNLLQHLSLLKSFERDGFEFRTPAEKIHHPDIFHTNSIEVLDGRIAERVPEFAAGNVLVSMRLLDRIAVVDLEQGRVVWTRTGSFRKQHDPKILANGNLLLFDNSGRPEQSSVQEYDPASMELVWEYRGTKEQPFYSEWCGTAQRLPNGNTLITESDFGRAFEVTPGGMIVWEFFNPHRAGEHGRYIASLLELVRLPPDFPVDWTN